MEYLKLPGFPQAADDEMCTNTRTMRISREMLLVGYYIHTCIHTWVGILVGDGQVRKEAPDLGRDVGECRGQVREEAPDLGRDVACCKGQVREEAPDLGRNIGLRGARQGGGPRLGSGCWGM